MCFFTTVCEEEICDKLSKNTKPDSHILSCDDFVSSSMNNYISHLTSLYDSTYDCDSSSHLSSLCDSTYPCDPTFLTASTSSCGFSDSHHLRLKLNDFYYHYWRNHKIRRRSF
jgi:hypothetical protein